MDKEKQKQVATQIANDPNLLAYLKEMFVPEYTALHLSSEKNILALNDADYGKAMKLFYLKRVENQLTLEEIKRLGHKTNERTGHTAPA